MEFLVVNCKMMETLTRQLHEQISKDYDPDIIIAIARGGWIPARLLCDLFERNNPDTILASMQIEFYQAIGKRKDRPIVSQEVSWNVKGKKLLVIDDLVDTGTSITTAIEYLTFRGPSDIKIGTLYYKPWAKIKPDYYIETTDAWVVFPHEYYEFMTERSLMKEDELTKEELRKEFTDLDIPKTSIDYFFKNFYLVTKDSD